MFATCSTSTRWWCTSLLIVFFALHGHAQIAQPARFEIPLSDDAFEYNVIPAHTNGLFLYRRLPATDEVDQVEILKLDTAFERSWHGFLPVDRKFLLAGQRSLGDRLYLLLRHMDPRVNSLELFSMLQSTGEYTRYFIRNYIPFSVSEFQVTKRAALMGGYFNRVPVVLHYSFETEKSKILPGLLNESGELTQIKTYDDGSFDVLISARNFKGMKTIWIKSYDADGNLLRNYALETGNHHLIFARSLKTNNDMQVVAGVYGARNTDYSKGLFIATIDPSGLQQMRYYNFADLENFFRYMKARREQRVKERIERRKIRGKKIRFTYRFLVHELVPYNDQYVLLGEAFYPRYTSLDRAYYGGFFNPYSVQNGFIRNGQVFDGYHYTHAVVMGFDRDGNLQWDNSFEINDVKTFTLEQFVKLEAQPDKIALLYLFDNEFRSKIIQGNEVLEGKNSEPIRTKLPNDVAKSQSRNTSKLEYWYGDYFYAYGIQEIANAQFGRRRVFFVNKVKY